MSEQMNISMRLALYLLPLWGITPSAHAQDTLAGYTRRITGETIGYSAYTPMASQALLTRTNTGQGVITWETEAVPQDFKGDTAYFCWVGGNAAGTSSGDEPYDLAIDGIPALTITTHKNFSEPGWFYRNDKGVSIRFERKALDGNNDVSGRVTLAVPRSMVTPGRPLRLSITGQHKDNQDWLMVYQYQIGDRFLAEVFPLLKRAPNGDTLRVIRIYGTYAKAQGLLKAAEGAQHKTFALHSDYNDVEWAVPYHQRDRSITLSLEVDGKKESDTFQLSPLEPLEVHLVHHSHTDIGYSNLQQEVAAIQNRNIREAIRLIEKTKDYPEAAQFRWNIESLWAVENFLDSASDEDVKAFGDALRTGRMTLQAFLANELTGLLDAEELTWLTAYARTLEKRFHVTVNSAMITDVPGYTWSTIQALGRAGIKYFSIGPNNSDRIGGVLSTWGDKPFYWKTPGTGQKVLTDVAGSSYAWFHGTPGARDPARLTQRLLAYVRHLNDEHYPYKYALVRYNIVSDNAPLDTGISDFIRNWNKTYIYPRLVLSTPTMALSAIEKAYGNKLPVYSGDMSPYWEDGAASTGMELGWNRHVRAGLEQTEALEALGGAAPDTVALAGAWRGVVMFDEHTWGAWCSISDPDNPFTVAQWQFKRNFLVTADSLARSLQPAPGTLQVVNTHSWSTHATVRIPGFTEGAHVTLADGSPLQQQTLSDGDRLVYLPDIPGFSAVILKAGESSHISPTGGATQNGYTFTNDHVRLQIDSLNGSITSLIWKGNDIVRHGNYGLNQYEYVPGRDPSEAQTAKVKSLDVTENGPLLTVIRLTADAPGARALKIEYRLDNITGKLIIIDSVDKVKVRTKEAVHFAFPMKVPGGDLVADNGSFPYRPFNDTLAGGNRDFGYIGKWMDLSNKDWGVTLCSLETPIMEWGSMRSEVIAPGSSVSAWKKTFAPTQTYFSYALNNYWHTNYKADQEGWVGFRYVLEPHGPGGLVDCYKRGEEAEAPPVLANGTIDAPLRLSNPDVVVATIIPVKGAIWVEVYNPSDRPAITQIKAQGKVYRSDIHQVILAPLGNQPVHLPAYGRVDLLLKP
ncbi:glycoside hydrolase family 38 N-terminal domain-containing protein [Dinghuibacter silviterrae]|uniref:Glycosyl hydrolase family 38 n=1 Tax=Dinghuibacter silviterrae TaxID=1539049 RepID=A0A4R8DGW1_9BACT|nr:hypothetical protein [Dinghuibacter silviterrae]TDW96921.1 glycosyl hydrolase family 38 [Dinghuibacter silviterrae]